MNDKDDNNDVELRKKNQNQITVPISGKLNKKNKKQKWQTFILINDNLVYQHQEYSLEFDKVPEINSE